MKKMMMALVALLTIAATGNAMSYEQARNEALFLTDKMAYELNLNEAQYEAAYEINLDYLMGVTSYDDVYGTYWERRNLDLSYVLLDWQWNAFCAASYFYRPLYWDAGYWHFGIYARYPHRDYFYFGRPTFYATYRGGHAWHHVGGRGYYHGRRDHFITRGGRSHFGMLDRWNRGDYRGHHPNGHVGGRGYYGGNRNSSTRTTVGGPRGYDNHSHGTYHGTNRGSFRGNDNRSHGSYRGNDRGITSRPSTSTSTRPSFRGEGSYRNSGGGNSSYRSSGGGNSSYRSSGGGSSSYRSSGGGSSSYRSNGGGSSSYRSSGSFGGSRGGGSFHSGGGSHGGGHSGGGSFHSSGGSHGGGHSGGGRSFGGHR